MVTLKQCLAHPVKLLSSGLDVGMEGILRATVQLTARKSERLPDGIELQRRHGAGWQFEVIPLHWLVNRGTMDHNGCDNPNVLGSIAP